MPRTKGSPGSKAQTVARHERTRREEGRGVGVGMSMGMA